MPGAMGGSYSSIINACHLLGSLKVLVEGMEGGLKIRLPGVGVEMELRLGKHSD